MTARSGGGRWDALEPLLLGALVASLVAGRFETAGLALLVSTLGAALAGARPPRRWWGALSIAVVVAIALNLYLNPGRPIDGLPALAGRPATHEGLSFGWLLVLRLAGAMAAMHGLLAIWSRTGVEGSVGRLLRPLGRLGMPVPEARLMLGVGMRLAPLLREEGARIRSVQALRAGRPPRSFLERVRMRNAAWVPAVVCALERADRLSLALEARHVRSAVPAPEPAGPAGSPGSRRVAGGCGVALALGALLWRI